MRHVQRRVLYGTHAGKERTVSPLCPLILDSKRRICEMPSAWIAAISHGDLCTARLVCSTDGQYEVYSTGSENRYSVGICSCQRMCTFVMPTLLLLNCNHIAHSIPGPALVKYDMYNDIRTVGYNTIQYF